MQDIILSTKLFFIMSLIFLSLTCSESDKKKYDPESRIVAKIGNEVITVADFRSNYEFGLSVLKTGDNSKETYLKHMIREKTLAVEGYRLGLENTKMVKSSQKKLMKELMLEALIESEIASKISVSQEEIEAEINKSKVSFKFRYWVEPSLGRATPVVADMRERGYAAVVDDILKQNPEVNFDPKKFETDYVTHDQIAPEFLEAIKDLPFGDISDPIKMNNQYYIFQVLDIHRKSVTSNEYKSKSASTKQMIYYQKLKKADFEYTKKIMANKKVVTKAKAFNLLNHALNEWRKNKDKDNLKSSFKNAVINAENTHPELLLLNKNLSQTLVTTTEKNYTLGEFIEFFNPNIVSRQLKGLQGIDNKLATQIQITIRDEFLVKEAEKLNLQTNPKVITQRKKWTDKWVYQAARQKISGKTIITETEAKAFFEEYKDAYKVKKTDQPVFEKNKTRIFKEASLFKQIAFLNAKIDSFEINSPVTIYYDVLDTIQVINFKKSKWASVQLYKGGSNLPAIPIIDGIWGVSDIPQFKEAQKRDSLSAVKK